MTNVDTDKQFQQHTIEKVEPGKDGWVVTFDACLILFVTNQHCQTEPQVGETIRTYGRGFGFTVRGIAIAGRVYRYQTDAEAEQEHRETVRRQKAERATQYEAKRSEFDARVAALPPSLRDRVERFRAIGGDEWRYEFESYELFSCEQAVVFAAALPTAAELQAFRALSYAEQRACVPAMSDGHSGNTFGQSLAMALQLLEAPELLPKMHGAMCPLAGCRVYGCFAAHEGLRGIQA